jgi:hypothetical protein
MKWELRDNESVTKLLYMLRVIHDILLKGALQVRDVILIRLERCDINQIGSLFECPN